ncbi:MAG: SDR family oxidoreductase [Candidatus Marinimicrobia bacterium]|nr:SDR family oxidoreductase [Candidatus Neomarinimicrobiota bacterium]
MNKSKSVKQSFDLTGKVAVISGGAGLLGEKHAEAIAEFGGIPILLDIDEKAGTKKASRISNEYQVDCEFMLCDITDESQILSVRDTLLSRFGHIDILINNAAIDPKIKDDSEINLSRLENFSIDQWNLELSVGLTGSMLCSKIFGYEMSKAGEGVILNISSDLGIIAPDQRIYKKDGLPENEQPVKPVTYSVIKHGLIGLTKYLATYWADKGVRCNALCPGGIYNNQPDEFVKKISNLIPLGRMADEDEYKASVVFMVSEASAYMNGSVVSMDGGRSCW